MNILQFENNRKQTQQDELKKRVIEIYRELLRIYEEDIETGIDTDHIYEEEENVDTRDFIAEAHEKIGEFEKSQPTIYICVEGGNLQSMGATCEMDFKIYDDQKSDEENFNTTAEEWDQTIKDLTEAGIIKGIY